MSRGPESRGAGPKKTAAGVDSAAVSGPPGCWAPCAAARRRTSASRRDQKETETGRSSFLIVAVVVAAVEKRRDSARRSRAHLRVHREESCSTDSALDFAVVC